MFRLIIGDFESMCLDSRLRGNDNQELHENNNRGHRRNNNNDNREHDGADAGSLVFAPSSTQAPIVAIKFTILVLIAQLFF